MPSVTFIPRGAKVNAAEGTLILDAAQLAGLAIDAPCGGTGTCGGCAVGLIEGTLRDGDRPVDAGETILACRASLAGGDVVIRIPDFETIASDSVEEDDDHQRRLDRVLDGRAPSPLCEKLALAVPPPGPEDGLSDIDRLVRSLPENRRGLHVPLSVMRNAASALRRDGGTATITLFNGRDGVHATSIEPGTGTSSRFGIAVDVGTTTVAVQLIDCATGRIAGTASGYNGQIACGGDVISRINYAATPDRLKDLGDRVIATVNRLVDSVCKAGGISREQIHCGVVSGNTVMTHLLLGLDPEYIRLEPYTPTVLRPPSMAAADLRITLHPEARLVFSSSVGSYVGGDITAGLLCTGIPDGRDGLSLFLDIGTNGELAIGNKDFIMACACSAGPAFEGSGLTCGMRAAPGAIDHISIDPDSGDPSFTVIGGGEPTGICGSGAIELLAELFRHGWMDARGRLAAERKSPRIIAEGRRARYHIAPPSLMISEADIDSIIRAKAAIYSAADLLLDKTGFGFGDVSRFYVAGGFGKYLDIVAAIAIGLLPDIPREKFVYLGNASLAGASLMLISERHRDMHDSLAERITYVNLSNEAGYMDRYTAALFIPHTDMNRFPGAAKP